MRTVGYTPVAVTLTTFSAVKLVIDLKVEILPTTTVMEELACA
jgi:hypothetical protein